MSSFRETLGDWEAFNSNLKAQLTELPDLVPEQQKFEVMLNQGLALSALQDQLIAALRDNNEQRRILLKDTRRAREFLVSALRRSIGFESKKLLGFGVRPREPRRKKAAGSVTEPPVPPPVAAKTAGFTPPQE